MLNQFLKTRYPGDSGWQIKVREFVESLCRKHIELRLADQNFESRLCSGDEAQFWQRFSEALLAHELLDVGLDLQPSRNGPDVLIRHEGRKIWVEVICPEPCGIPDDWLSARCESFTCVSFPHEAILLRWTAAIKEKAEKLWGYLEKGVVSPDDSYVIAVNGRMLRNTFGDLFGISQLPFAVEAVFAVGPYKLVIDRATSQVVDRTHQHRPIIPKNGSPCVPATMFQNPMFKAVSAIWATDIDDCGVVGRPKGMLVVHNPIAVNPIPEGLLPATSEYVASDGIEGEYLISIREGRLAADHQ